MKNGADRALMPLSSYERSTADDYTKAIRAWVRSIGNLPMESVTEDVLRDGMRDMLSKGITPRTLSKRYTILKTILDAAERRGHIAENPLRWIKKPRVDETERNYLPKDERERQKTHVSRSTAYVRHGLRGRGHGREDAAKHPRPHGRPRHAERVRISG